MYQNVLLEAVIHTSPLGKVPTGLHPCPHPELTWTWKVPPEWSLLLTQGFSLTPRHRPVAYIGLGVSFY